MAVIECGKNWRGEPCIFSINDKLKENLDVKIKIVTKKDFDYVAVICGLPGVGKSNFSQTLARYCCPWFDQTYIAFTADEFIKITNNCPKFSSVVLDESFASLNAKISMTPDFIKIINHLQMIRQKNLFVFLCLPNFFDLSKGIAIYRASHLFVVYGEVFGERGRFAAFDRESKKKLYVLGQKFINYHAADPNFRGKFIKQKVIDEEVYKDIKLEHLKMIEEELSIKRSRFQAQRNNAIFQLREKGMDIKELARIFGLKDKTVYDVLEERQEFSSFK